MTEPKGATKGVRRRVALAAAERYVRMLLQFVSVALLARLLTPEELGIYAIAMSVVLILQSLRDFGVGRYLIQVKEVTAEQVRAVMGIGMTMGVLVAAILALGAIPFADFYGERAMAPIFWVLAVNALALPLNTPAIALLEREMSYGPLFVIRVSGSAVNVATTVTLAIMGFGFMSMAWGSLAGTVVYIAMTSWFRPRQAWVAPGFRGWRRAFSFGGMVSLATLVTDGAEATVDMIVGKALGFAAVANIGRGLALMRLFDKAVVLIVRRVGFSTIAAMLREGRDVTVPYLKASGYLTALAWPFYGFVGALTAPVIYVVFGPQWGDAVPAARILALAGCVGALVVGLNQVLLMAHGEAGKYLRAEIVVQSGRLALIVPAAFTGIEAVAWAYVAGKVLEVTVYQFVLRRLMGLTVGQVARAQWRSVVVGLGATAAPLAVVLAQGQDWPWWLDLGLAIPGCLAGWLAAVLLVRHPIGDEFARLVAHLGGRGR